MSRGAPVAGTPAKLHTPVFCELKGVVFFTITCEQLRDLATTLTPPTEPLPQLLSLSQEVFTLNTTIQINCLTVHLLFTYPKLHLP